MSGVSSKPQPALAISPGWRPWQALIATLLIFTFSQLIIGLLLAASGVDLDNLSTSTNIGLGVAAGSLSIVLTLWFAGWFGAKPRRALGLVKPKQNIWPLLGLALLAFVVISSLLSLAVDSLWPSFEAEQEQDIGLGSINGSWQYLATFVLLVVVAPISEELIFRGVLFAGWRGKGFVPAALVSSVLFGLAHWQPNVALATAVLGWLLAYLYEKTGSLWAPIGLHAAKNALAFALVYGGGIS